MPELPCAFRQGLRHPFALRRGDPFDTDELALEEVMKTIAEEGIGSLVGEPESG